MESEIEYMKDFKEYVIQYKHRDDCILFYALFMYIEKLEAELMRKNNEQ